MRHAMGVIALSLTIGGLSAWAGPVSYTIDFTTASGVAPTSGSFDFDATSSTFTDFMVDWHGIAFDFTASANSPTFSPASATCLHGASGALAAFYELTQCVGPAGDAPWGVRPISMAPYQDFHLYQAGGGYLMESTEGTSSFDMASGTYSVAATPAAPTPEPGSFALTLIGVGLAMRKRIVTGLRLATRHFRSPGQSETLRHVGG